MGWSLLTINLLIAVTTAGWGFGLVSLPGVLSLAAIVVIGLLTYHPTLLIAIAAGNGVVGIVLIGLVWVI